MKQIPYARQDISRADIDSVVDVLNSVYLTQGPSVPNFENSVLSFCGTKHAVAVNSATSALHIACLALGLGQGDWLWTSPITFVASANCALYCGASVDFVDIDPISYNMSPQALASKLEKAEQENKLPKVVVAVHFCGNPCDMSFIHDLSKRYGFKIIEDAAHAIGGKYLGVPIGSCRYSDITIFSFHPVKIITTGEGGMALTNDDKYAERLRLLRSHGITRDPHLMTKEMEGPWYYQQVALGYNYRMTDLQGALGVSQMTRLKQFVDRRHELASRYDELLKGLPLTVPWQNLDGYSGMHLYVIRLHLDQIKKSHREVFEGLREQGVVVNLHYIPVHLQPYYQRLGFKVGQFPEAERFYSEAISIPMYASLSDEEQNKVVEVISQTIL